MPFSIVFALSAEHRVSGHRMVHVSESAKNNLQAVRESISRFEDTGRRCISQTRSDARVSMHTQTSFQRSCWHLAGIQCISPLSHRKRPDPFIESLTLHL